MKIASYNVENLFDMKEDGTEYEQYFPNTSWGWTTQMQRIKLQHTARVIHDINADVIGLQEIESESVLKELKAEINRQGLYYPYYVFSRNKRGGAVSVALLSRYPITSAISHPVSANSDYRNILEARIDFKGHPLRVYVNHWKSKMGPESMRIRSAKVVKKLIDKLPKNEPYILVGDFNSHYEEYKIFLKSRRHNDTNGVTGINHILQTIDDDENPITYTTMKSTGKNLYNLWYELPSEQRWSHSFKGKGEGLDNIIISPALANDNGIEYVRGSFTRFTPEYLFNKGKVYRWQQSKSYPKHHTGEGYSDHLPVSAVFEVVGLQR